MLIMVWIYSYQATGYQLLTRQYPGQKQIQMLCAGSLGLMVSIVFNYFVFVEENLCSLSFIRK